MMTSAVVHDSALLVPISLTRNPEKLAQVVEAVCHIFNELAQLSPVDGLPLAMREQLKASAELADAVWRASRTKGAPPQLDPQKLRLKMGERIRSAALRAGGAA